MTRQFKDDLAVLASPAFVIALSLLLINDWVLKPWWHDWLTGKLSDFSGVFVFGTLLVLLVPRRPHFALVFVAVFFAWWKSPLSQAAIEFSNAHLPLRVGRTVDYTDLMALVVLPFVEANRRRWQGRKVSRFALYPLGLLGVFAVCATSQLPPSVGGAVHLEDESGASVDALYAAIDSFAEEHGLTPGKDKVEGWARQYHGPGGLLDVNYEPRSHTLYYSLSEYGGVKGDLEDRDKEFRSYLSRRFPGIQILERDKASMELAGEIIVHLPGEGPEQGELCRLNTQSPDVQTLFTVLDAFASENQLRQSRQIEPWDAQCQRLLLDPYYLGGTVVGPTRASYSLSVGVGRYGLDRDTFFIFFDGYEDASVTAKRMRDDLYQRLKVQHWSQEGVDILTEDKSVYRYPP